MNLPGGIQTIPIPYLFVTSAFDESFFAGGLITAFSFFGDFLTGSVFSPPPPCPNAVAERISDKPNRNGNLTFNRLPLAVRETEIEEPSLHLR